jgi:hypothetical protein
MFHLRSGFLLEQIRTRFEHGYLFWEIVLKLLNSTCNSKVWKRCKVRRVDRQWSRCSTEVWGDSTRAQQLEVRHDFQSKWTIRHCNCCIGIVSFKNFNPCYNQFDCWATLYLVLMHIDILKRRWSRAHHAIHAWKWQSDNKTRYLNGICSGL